MPLEDVDIPDTTKPLPLNVEEFIADAEKRIARYFERDPKKRVPRFVPSDFRNAYATLRVIKEKDLALGNSFCEWGSGFGVISSLAALLDYESCGIEIEPDLVTASEKLASEYDIPVQFLCKSYIPEEFDYYSDGIGEASNLTRDHQMPSEIAQSSRSTDNEVEDFDVIFTFPWPGEGELVEQLFDQCAAEGALLLTYEEYDTVRVRRRVV